MFSVVLIFVFTIIFCAWNRDERINDALDPIEASQCYNAWDKVLKCFSLQNNWKWLMDDTIAPNSISVINGIKWDIHKLPHMKILLSHYFFGRSISCFLILSFHLFWFSFYATSNPGVLFHLSEKVRFQWIANAALMVDSFFCIRYVDNCKIIKILTIEFSHIVDFSSLIIS